MRLKNKKTGTVIDSPFNIVGGDWIKETVEQNDIVEDSIQDVDKVDEPIADPEDELSEMEDVTKKEIMQELDAFGIKYDANAKKQELYDLLMQGK